MKYITSTELRTKSKELTEVLRDGGSVTLIHRSQPVGVITPYGMEKKKEFKKFDAEAFKRAVEKLNLDIPDSYEERDAIYRKHLMEKYGQGLR